MFTKNKKKTKPTSSCKTQTAQLHPKAATYTEDDAVTLSPKPSQDFLNFFSSLVFHSICFFPSL
jgi:hypothetical protein